MHKKEAISIILTAIASLVLLSLVSGISLNKIGVVGSYFANFCFKSLGYFAYFLPLWLLLGALKVFKPLNWKNLLFNIFHWILFTGAAAGLAQMYLTAPLKSGTLKFEISGLLGMKLIHWLSSLVNQTGATLILTAIFFLSSGVLLNISWLNGLKWLVILQWSWLKRLSMYLKKKDFKNLRFFSHSSTANPVKLFNKSPGKISKLAEKLPPIGSHAHGLNDQVNKIIVVDNNHARDINPLDLFATRFRFAFN